MKKLNLDNNNWWCFRLYWSDEVDNGVFLVPKTTTESDIENIVKEVQKIDDYNTDYFENCLIEKNIQYFAFNIEDIEF